MITTICAGDWLQFQQIKQGKLITEQGNVTAFPDFPKWLWVGDRIVADSDGKPLGDLIVLAHVSGDATDRIDERVVVSRSPLQSGSRVRTKRPLVLLPIGEEHLTRNLHLWSHSL